jgi:hypothetical protein
MRYQSQDIVEWVHGAATRKTERFFGGSEEMHSRWQSGEGGG